MNFAEGKKEFLDLYNRLDSSDKCRFSRWVGGFAEAKIDEIEPTENEAMLDVIGDELRKYVEPPGGKMKNEIVSSFHLN